MARPKGVPDMSDIKPFVWLAHRFCARKTCAGRLVWLAENGALLDHFVNVESGDFGEDS